MVRKAARLAFPQIQLEFHTENSHYKITNDSDNQIGIENYKTSSALSNAIVSFQTQNTLGDNIGSFTIVLSGMSIRWNNILNMNDIVTIRVDPNEYESDTPVYNTNIFTGLVSEVSVIGQYGEDSLMFQISGQSFAKAFTQYKIGLISQIENQIANMGWLWDINAKYDPAVEDTEDEGGVSNISSGSQKKNAVSIGQYFKRNVSGATKNAICGLLGNWQQESGLNPEAVEGNGAGHGLAQWTGGRWNALNAYAKKKNKSWKNLGLQLDYALHGDGADSSKLKELLKQNGSVSEMTDKIQKQYERAGTPNMNNRISYAKYWAKYLDKKLGSGSSGGGGSSDKGSSSSSSSGGGVDSTADMIAKEKNSSVGVAFFGNTVATIENNLVNRFKPYMVYSYDGGTKTLWDYLDYSKMQSWSDYEFLFDSSQFTNANGSLWDLQQNALRIPFNEMFFDSMADGKSKMVVRRTPFNPEDWNQLTKVTVDSRDIIDHEVTKTDAQQYSVFVVNPASSTILGIADGMLLSAYPQTNQALINYYGYSKYEVDDLYLSGREDDNNSASKRDAEVAKDKAKDKSDKDKDKAKKADKSKKKPTKPTIVPAPTTPSSSNPGSVITPHPNGTIKRSLASDYIEVRPDTSMDLLLRKDDSKSKTKDSKSKSNSNNHKGKSSKPTPVKKKDKGTKTSSKDNTLGKPFSDKDVASYLNGINRNTLRLNKNKYAKGLADAANNISAAQAYALVDSFCANGYIMSKETFDTVMNTATGGGLPNTGTKEASYENMKWCIEQAKGDQNAFMSIAKSTLKNVSDEFLRQVWQVRNGKGSLDKKDYEQVYKDARNAGNLTGDAVSLDLKFFARVLYNWYADNFNFYSGSITIAGNPDVRVGCILDEVDFYNRENYGYAGMRYYIESVAHRFSFTEGYTTVVGVTRGMKMPSGEGTTDPRFTNLWGTSIDYVGGYMGEATTANLAYSVADSDDDSDGDGDDSFGGGAKGNEIAVKAAKFGYSFRKDGNPKIKGKKMKEVYSYGAGHGGSKNPLTNDLRQGTIALDCSSFTYWCFKHFGVDIGGVTTSQLNDPKFKKVKIGQSSKNMKVGDLVFMNGCSHVMFYIGDNKLMGWNGSGSWDSSGGCKIQTIQSVISYIGKLDPYVARFK